MSEIYSHSRLSSFEDCAKKFEYRYVLKLKRDTESIEGFVGKQVHKVLERLYGFAAQGMVPSLDKVIGRFRIWWNERYDPARVRIVRTENDADYYREIGERCLGNYYRRCYPFDGDETLATEEHVVFSLDAADRYRIQGFIDRVVRTRDGAVEIHDYKTSARVPPQSRLDGDRQLALYQIGLTERFGAQTPMRLVWHYLAPNQVRTSSRSPEQLDTLRTDTIDLIDRVRATTHFEPKTGPLCRWCEFADVCPAQNESREAREEPSHALTKAQPAARRGQLPLA
ncbi:MAG: PD-(D/E)XK nuclease family protein [Myxococcota bacterium]|nr:PD-(D/E)XK nuclease family protein [Myxococcota bacterium]